MAELAKTHITITDESASAAGGTTLVPLYVFATEQDKVIDENTGAIAPATTKELANQLLVVTSRNDCVNSYGVPKFTTVAGTVQQGDELNEVGLFGLYDSLGATSVAYALRADIDLKQLKSQELEPTAKVKNNTKWLDVENTSWGFFINEDPNKSIARRWSQVTDVVVVEELKNNKPEIDPEEGELAVYFEKLLNGTKVVGLRQRTYQAVAGEWYEIGTPEWKAIVAEDEYNEPEVVFSSYLNYPTNNVKGSIWVKTSPVNNGVAYDLKQYKSETDRWSDVNLPMFKSFVEAETTIGTALSTNSLIAKYEEDSDRITFYQFGGEGFKKSSEEIANFTLAYPQQLEINTPFGSVNVEFSSREYTVDDVASLIRAQVSTLGKYGYAVSVDGKKLVLLSTNGYAFGIDGEETIMSCIKLDNGEYSDWNLAIPFEVSEAEPTAEPEDGTLWFNGDDYIVDIMVSDGDSWKGYNNEYPNASIYVTSAEPDTTIENSLWIDPSDSDYPRIYRMYDGAWELIDNTDQTSPLGILFADARAYASETEVGTFALSDDGKVISNLLTSDFVEPDAPSPQAYPAGMLLFNTRFSTNNVKAYKSNVFEGLAKKDGSYSVGGFEANVNNFASTSRWVTASGNAENGAGLFGRKAQRKMIVNALASAIKTNEDIRTMDYDFFFASCPGYPELDDELISLNVDKKETFEIVSDTPARLKPSSKSFIEWGSNKNNAVSHGEDGRVLKNEFVTRQYPSVGLASNVDGLEVAVPTSIAKMRNLLVLPRGQIAAGTENGQVTNMASVGYITDEEEYTSVVLNDGMGETLVAQSINPIMPRRNSGLLFWGEWTENPIQTSSLSDEHGIITILRLKRDLETAVQPFFFKINNEALRSDFHKVLQNVLDIYIGTGEIYDYTLVTDSSVNTAARIGRKELWASIAIEIAKGVEQIYLPIRVVATGALSGNS